MSGPRGYTRKDVESLYSPIQQHGVRHITETINASNTQEVKSFGDVSQSMCFQADGTLVCNVETTVNGVNWTSMAAGVSSASIATFDTHPVVSVRVVWVSGEGKLHLIGSI